MRQTSRLRHCVGKGLDFVAAANSECQDNCHLHGLRSEEIRRVWHEPGLRGMVPELSWMYSSLKDIWSLPYERHDRDSPQGKEYKCQD